MKMLQKSNSVMGSLRDEWSVRDRSSSDENLFSDRNKNKLYTDIAYDVIYST